MSTSIQIDLPPDSAELIARVQQAPAALTRNLLRELDLLNQDTVGHIIAARATGQGPFPPDEGKLGVISSRYRRGVRNSKALVSGTAIESAIGNNVKYAAAHEFGVHKTVQVKAHRARNTWLDVLDAGGTQVARWESFGVRGKKKKVAEGFVQVKAHPMQMNLPARAPIRRGIDDRLPLYGPRLGAAIVATFKPGQS